jgi:hypothetical protein
LKFNESTLENRENNMKNPSKKRNMFETPVSRDDKWVTEREREGE